MTPRTYEIRDVVSGDYPTILAINNAAVPAMNEQSHETLAWLVANSAYARVTVGSAGVEAFLLGLPPGRTYESENYRWFASHFDEFLYIDRIAVAADARGAGRGSALYDDIAAFARGRWPRILAEVNSDPPNPRSVAFHERHGFVAVGELIHAAGSHANRVTMMERLLR